MKIFLFWLFALSALSGTVRAQDVASARLVGGADMQLYGMGGYENLGEDIYIGALYIPQLENAIRPGSSKRMEMAIVAENLSARRFTQLWMDAITLSGSREERVAQAEQIQQFGKLFQDRLIRGDRVSFLYLESGRQTVVMVNEVTIGAIAGAEFFNILLDAWVGDPPQSAQLKAGILGLIGEEKRVLIKRQFAGIQFTDERQQEIAALYAAGSRQDVQIPERSAQQTAGLQDAPRAEETVSGVASSDTARLEADRETKRLEAERSARLEEEARIKAEKAAAARGESERLAAEQARFAREQELLADDYRGELIKWLGNYVEYPQRALQKGQEGRVELSVSTNRDGEILRKEIVSSSGDSALDQAALRMLERGSPLPAMPGNLAGDNFSFSMPVSFSLGKTTN